MLPFGSMAASTPGKDSTLAERVTFAMIAEGRERKVGPTEQQVGYSAGHLGRIMKGERGGTTVDVNRLKMLADLLHVERAWLVLGEGPMRREGRTPTPAEEAMTFAREAGCREDAWQEAWERNKDREAEMTAMDWALAINAEAVRLDRSGVKRPEIAASERAAIQRTKKKLERSKARKDEESKDATPTTSARPRRASGV